MAQNGDGVDVRGELVELLLKKLATEPYPSTTTLNVIEEILTPEELPAYARILMDKVATEAFPSVSMLKRLQAVV